MPANRFKISALVSLVAIVLALVAPSVIEASETKPRWVRDPFRYPIVDRNGEKTTEVSDTADELSDKGLKGIYIHNGKYRAVYDGQIVQAGERLGNIVIRKISRYSIVIEDGNKLRTIKLFDGE